MMKHQPHQTIYHTRTKEKRKDWNAKERSGEEEGGEN